MVSSSRILPLDADPARSGGVAVDPDRGGPS